MDGNDSDSALIARVAQRDAAAFGVLVDRHATPLYRIAARVTGDVAEAEDIAQEAMLRLWDQAPQWNARGLNLAAWLRRIAVNLAIDRQRRMRRLAGDAIPDTADETPLADAQMERTQQGEGARRMIAALPDRQRAAIVLTYYEELSNNDAAAALDMKLKAFESLLVRARSALREALADVEDTPRQTAGAGR